MEEKDLKEAIQKQSQSCDEKYVLEKAYWQRGLKALIVALGVFLSVMGGIVAWGFATAHDVNNNTQGRHALEQRIEIVDRQNTNILQNHETLAENQKQILEQQERLIKKLDLLIDRQSR